MVTKDSEPWFVLSGLRDILGFRDNHLMSRYLDTDEKGTLNKCTPGGEQEVTIVSESGLYSLILKSRKPNAKRFKKWVTSEVLPSIRKTCTCSCQ